MEKAVNGWLRRRSAWQFMLTAAVATAIGCLIGGILGQLGRHHLDWGELLGLASGGAAGASIIAVWYRQNQQRS
jgi:uncharacterized transporter YbjL